MLILKKISDCFSANVYIINTILLKYSNYIGNVLQRQKEEWKKPPQPVKTFKQSACRQKQEKQSNLKQEKSLQKMSLKMQQTWILDKGFKLLGHFKGIICAYHYQFLQ